MTTYLLDANVLIALTITEHEQYYKRATAWMAGVDRFALAYLLDLARHHRGASLATFDDGLTVVDPSRVVMVPELAD